MYSGLLKGSYDGKKALPSQQFLKVAGMNAVDEQPLEKTKGGAIAMRSLSSHHLCGERNGSWDYGGLLL